MIKQCIAYAVREEDVLETYIANSLEGVESGKGAILEKIFFFAFQNEQHVKNCAAFI